MKFNKVVLAYSGGLDTSVIAKWLMEKYKCEVITFTADIGQGSETKDARVKAKKLGIKKIYIEDLTEEFVKNAGKLSFPVDKEEVWSDTKDTFYDKIRGQRL